MGKSDILILLAGLGAGAGFVLLTNQGKSMFEEFTGIQVPDIGFSLDGILADLGLGGGYDYEDEGGVEELVESERERSSGGNYSKRRGRKLPAAGYHPNYSSTDYSYPVQDLFIPPNYFDFKYQSDPYRVPSKEFGEWYAKGSGLIPEDYYFPDHYYWNPDYYYYFGNLYKMWYPNVNDISHVPLRRMPYWFGEVYY